MQPPLKGRLLQWTVPSVSNGRAQSTSALGFLNTNPAKRSFSFPLPPTQLLLWVTASPGAREFRSELEEGDPWGGTPTHRSRLPPIIRHLGMNLGVISLSLLWAELCPPKRYAQVLTRGTCEAVLGNRTRWPTRLPDCLCHLSCASHSGVLQFPKRVSDSLVSGPSHLPNPTRLLSPQIFTRCLCSF